PHRLPAQFESSTLSPPPSGIQTPSGLAAKAAVDNKAAPDRAANSKRMCESGCEEKAGSVGDRRTWLAVFESNRLPIAKRAERSLESAAGIGHFAHECPEMHRSVQLRFTATFKLPFKFSPEDRVCPAVLAGRQGCERADAGNGAPHAKKNGRPQWLNLIPRLPSRMGLTTASRSAWCIRPVRACRSISCRR